MRTYVVQVLALLLVVAGGGVEFWHTGVRTASGLVGMAARPGSVHAGTAVPSSPQTGVAAAVPVTFRGSVLPAFRAHCSACHLDGNGSGGLHLDSYQGLRQGGSLVPGSVFQPGDHARSILWQIIRANGDWPGGNRMPLDGPYLSARQIQVVTRWIDQGARDN